MRGRVRFSGTVWRSPAAVWRQAAATSTHHIFRGRLKHPQPSTRVSEQTRQRILRRQLATNRLYRAIPTLIGSSRSCDYADINFVHFFVLYGIWWSDVIW
jgi:hypothetical protein